MSIKISKHEAYFLAMAMEDGLYNIANGMSTKQEAVEIAGALRRLQDHLKENSQDNREGRLGRLGSDEFSLNLKKFLKKWSAKK